MKYTVSINETKRSITVTLADGTKGVARCNPSDRFDINTGVELALERAKVAKANAEKAKEVKPTPMASQMTVTMLAKQLEKTLPKGHIIVAVGGGDSCLTANGKAWLAKIAGVSAKGCSCSCHDDGDYYTEDEIENIKTAAYDEGHADGYDAACAEYDKECEGAYDEGYADGYADAEADYDDIEVEELDTALARIREVLADVGIIV